MTECVLLWKYTNDGNREEIVKQTQEDETDLKPKLISNQNPWSIRSFQFSFFCTAWFFWAVTSHCFTFLCSEFFLFSACRTVFLPNLTIIHIFSNNRSSDRVFFRGYELNVWLIVFYWFCFLWSTNGFHFCPMYQLTINWSFCSLKVLWLLFSNEAIHFLANFSIQQWISAFSIASETFMEKNWSWSSRKKIVCLESKFGTINHFSFGLFTSMASIETN